MRSCRPRRRSPSAWSARNERSSTRRSRSACRRRTSCRTALGEVLAVLYLMFNEGYLATGARGAADRDLAAEAEWLTVLLARLMPDEPEVLGLLALMRFNLARADARFDATASSCCSAIRTVRSGTVRLIEADVPASSAASSAWGGPVRISCRRSSPARTPTRRAGRRRAGTRSCARTTRCSASRTRRSCGSIARSRVWHVEGPASALAEVDALADALERLPPVPCDAGELLRALGRTADARAADERALELTENPAERALLTKRLATRPR